jgi:hypothetical protein
LIVGTNVVAKATFITHESECKRRYGAAWATKFLEGVVTKSESIPNPISGRKFKYVTASFRLGGGQVRTAVLALAKIKLPPPVAPLFGGVTTISTGNDGAVALPVPQPTVPFIPIAAAVPGGDVTIPTQQSNNTATNDGLEGLEVGIPPLPHGIDNEVLTSPSATDTSTIEYSFLDEGLANNTAGTSGSESGLATQVPSVNSDVVPPLMTTTAVLNTSATTETTTTTETTATTTSVLPGILNPGTQPTTRAHETDWYANQEHAETTINPIVARREWQLMTTTQQTWSEGCNNGLHHSRLDVFLQMFPATQLVHIVNMTSNELVQNRKKPTTAGEILQLFGIFLLSTKYEFTSWRSLWSTQRTHKYESAPDFGRTKVSRHRTDDLRKCLRFSTQPNTIPTAMNSEQYRWLLVDDFIRNFNNHRHAHFQPSEMLCVDESMVRWYGMGGDWINEGLPNYVAIDRKPENGCEIQNLACGKSGVMMRLHLVKTSTELHSHLSAEEREMNHGTCIVKQLAQPWFHSNRIICCDSYFSSVATAKMLLAVGMRMIGVVKTATKQFPMAHLTNLEMTQRGDRLGLVAYDAITKLPNMLAFVWVDRERRYFIATTGSVGEGQGIIRQRMRQVVDDGITPPTMVTINIRQPIAAEEYYKCCGKIDQHNRDRQDTLQFERKIGTKDWSMRVNLGLVAMCIVDSWKVWSKMTQRNGEPIETQKEFYSKLCTELIDNQFDTVGRRSNVARSDSSVAASVLIDPETNLPRSGVGIHLTPTSNKRKRLGSDTNHRLQRRCNICGRKTSFQCSQCKDTSSDGNCGFLCHTTTGRTCFLAHVDQNHS